MDVTELKAEMDQRFDQVDRRFEQIDQRFEEVDRQFGKLDQQVAAESERTRRHVEVEGENTRRHVEAEGENTRRHFDIVAEQMKSERNLSLDRSQAATERVNQLSATNAADHVTFARQLDDHEHRLRRLEK